MFSFILCVFDVGHTNTTLKFQHFPIVFPPSPYTSIIINVVSFKIFPLPFNAFVRKKDRANGRWGERLMNEWTWKSHQNTYNSQNTQTHTHTQIVNVCMSSSNLSQNKNKKKKQDSNGNGGWFTILCWVFLWDGLMKNKTFDAYVCSRVVEYMNIMISPQSIKKYKNNICRVKNINSSDWEFFSFHLCYACCLGNCMYYYLLAAESFLYVCSVLLKSKAKPREEWRM